jgi:hypothetical protein
VGTHKSHHSLLSQGRVHGTALLSALLSRCSACILSMRVEGTCQMMRCLGSCCSAPGAHGACGTLCLLGTVHSISLFAGRGHALLNLLRIDSGTCWIMRACYLSPPHHLVTCLGCRICFCGAHPQCFPRRVESPALGNPYLVVCCCHQAAGCVRLLAGRGPLTPQRRVLLLAGVRCSKSRRLRWVGSGVAATPEHSTPGRQGRRR